MAVQITQKTMQEKVDEIATFENIISWLESKPRDMGIDCCNSRACIGSLFLQEALGEKYISVGVTGGHLMHPFYTDKLHSFDFSSMVVRFIGECLRMQTGDTLSVTEILEIARGM